jgi:hypothetical protein
MKKTKKILLVSLLIFTAVGVISCGGGSSSDNSSGGSQLFGELPQMAAKYQDKIDKKKDDLKKCTDLNKAFKLDKELKLLEEEADTKMNKIIANGDKPIIVPVTQEGNTEFYKVTELSVVKADVSGITVITDVEILKEPFPGSFIYLQAYSGDTPLPTWILISSVYGVKGEIKAGQVCQFKQSIPMSFVTGVTKLVARTEEEYNARSK